MSLASNTTKNRNDGDAVVVDADEDRTARSVLKKMGFDPEDISKGQYNNCGWTPLMFFSMMGNVTMVRYLINHRGADCRQLNAQGRCSLYIAAGNGHLQIVQFLYYDGGAHKDLRRVDALRIALLRGQFDVIYWLIQNGALTPSREDVEDGGIDDMVLRRDFRQDDDCREDKRLPILAWAQNAVTNHDNFQLFLKGTILAASTFCRHPNNDYATRSNKRLKLAVTTATATATTPSSSPLVLFQGQAGILELISHYVGRLPPRDLRTFRQLLVLLPAFIEDVPFEVEEENEEEDDDDDDEEDADY